MEPAGAAESAGATATSGGRPAAPGGESRGTPGGRRNRRRSAAERYLVPPPVQLRPMKLQLLRRLVQCLVLVLLVMIPVSARYANYLAARELDKLMTRWDGALQGRALRAVDAIYRALPGHERLRGERLVRDRKRILEATQAVRGGALSLQLGPLSLTDPLAGLESMVASRTAARVLWIGLLVPVALTLVLGKIFCSWICPMGFVFEMTDKLRRVLRFLELRLVNVVPSRSLKFILLGLGLALAAALGAPILVSAYAPAVFARELRDLISANFDLAESGRLGFALQGFSGMAFFLLGLLLVELTASRRWWCRYICPGGATYALLGSRRLLRVQRDPERCTRCGRCDAACHLGLEPMADQTGLECDNCGQCVSNCRDDAIHLRLVAPWSRAGGKRRPVAAALLILALLLGGPAVRAHHILGIPHYAYDERYPQVPVLTYLADAGPIEVRLTGYPGKPAPGEQCFINIYLKEIATGEPYATEVTFRVFLDRMLGGDELIYGPVTAGIEDAVYKFYPRFEDEADYRLRIDFTAEGAPWTIELPMVVGQPGSPLKVVLLAGGAVLLFLLVVRALRIKLQRARQAAKAGEPPLSGSGSPASSPSGDPPATVEPEGP